MSQTGGLPLWAKRKGCACAPVASVASNKDLIFARIFVIYDCQAFATDNQGLNCIKRILMLLGPRWEMPARVLCRQWGQNRRVICQFGQEIGNVADNTQKRADVRRGFGGRPL